jgi:hypothetical protein
MTKIILRTILSIFKVGSGGVAKWGRQSRVAQWPDPLYALTSAECRLGYTAPIAIQETGADAQLPISYAHVCVG